MGGYRPEVLLFMCVCVLVCVCVYTYHISSQLDEKLFALEGNFHYFQPGLKKSRERIKSQLSADLPHFYT